MIVAMMGLGLSLAADVQSTVARRDQEAELLAIGRQFQRALSSYYNTPVAQGVPQYPLSMDELLEDRRGPVLRRHLRKLFTDPMTRSTQWGEIRIGGRIVGIHSLSEAAPIKRDNFDPDLQHLAGRPRLSEWIFQMQP